MRYISFCSGIEAATVAWHPLGWQPVAFAEIDKFPSAVLRHHYPDVPNHGDFTTMEGYEYGSIDLAVAGTPCQDFSVAGLRAGMDGKRGQLTVEFAHLAHRLAARAGTRWMVWENVPGVLSIDGGEAFATFLGILAGRVVRVPAGGWQNSGVVAGAVDGFGLCYRVLDAQHFGVPQRRRRVFVVGYFGDWRRAAAVLLERHSLSGHPAPRRETRQSLTHDLAPSLTGSGRGTERTGESRGQDPVIAVCMATGQGSAEIGIGIGTTLNCNHEAPIVTALVPVAIQAGCVRENPDSGPDGVGVRTDGVAYTLEARAEVQAVAIPAMAVRRLTPRECEKLQGFSLSYTKISGKTADGPRYKALGNSMAVPVMRWIGKKIQEVEDLTK